MKRKEYRYSAEVKIKDGWQWMLGTDDLSSAKHHLRCQVDKHPGLVGRIIDKTTSETAFTDPDPDALKIRFRENEGDDWGNLELTYVDKERESLHLRDGSDTGVWLSINQVHPDDREAALEFGRKLERQEYTPEEIKMWGEFYWELHQLAERIRKTAAEQKGDAGPEAN